jgi:aldehyde:ferredoxin oxidoreductase
LQKVYRRRAVQLQRKLYMRFSGVDEEFPVFLAEELPDGPSRGSKIERIDFENARRQYYSVMGWDEQGRPLPETLERLGI